ncbi:hypothetical protein ACIGFK_33225 [Streptomyces sp. NPDC085524]
MTLDACEAPDDPWSHLQPGPSQELIDRAHVGWQRFIASIEEPSDD